MNLVGNVFLIEDNGLRYICQDGKRLVLPKRLTIYVAKYECVQLHYSGANAIYRKSFSSNGFILDRIKEYLNNILIKDVLYEHEAMPKTLTKVRVDGYPPLVTTHNGQFVVYNPFTKERTYMGVATNKSNSSLARSVANSILEDMQKYRYTEEFEVEDI